MAQWLNIPGCTYWPITRFFKPELTIPHFMVKNISRINPKKLWKYGVRGLVFDKDNTLTAPYEMHFHPSTVDIMDEYKRVFGDAILIDSNSAGTKDDKTDEAKKIEEHLGIKVLQHTWKKPAGFGPVRDYFEPMGIRPYELMMFGDRIFTDVVFGNRYGMLTTHVVLLTTENDCKSAAKIREKEIPYVKNLISRGVQASQHKLYNSNMCLDNLITTS